jgi:Mg-chelatase subunit ChlD
MAYVPGSSRPPAALTDRALAWRLGAVPIAGIGVRFRLRPLEPGSWPTNVEAVADYVDREGTAGRLVFPVPVVHVAAPTPTPTPPPTATPTPSPSASAPPTATATPTPSEVARPGRLFLPVVLDEACDPKAVSADIALVLDASTSMLQTTASGRTKLAAATEAAGTFLDRIDLSKDQAAVVVFHSEAVLLGPLTSDRARLDAALGAIRVQPQSRIDRGIAVAADELRSVRHRPTSRTAMIVLTDGRANPSTPHDAVVEAERAKAAGVTVFTIGLGDDLDLEALRAMASRPEYFFLSPTGDDLERIYAEIAVIIPCPPEGFWGRR